MAEQPEGDFILGIDLGSNSLGWALVERENAEPRGLLRAGVRIFEAATEGDRESGQEESRNRARREARLHRRQLWRRARRLKKIFGKLQNYGLLPAGTAAAPEERQNFLNQLDQSILDSPWFVAKIQAGGFPEPRHTVPYILRAAALDEPLEPHFLGRALYHLAQRRGFLSNRLRPAKKNEDEGEVKKGISELRQKMTEAGARTLGEHFSRLSPSEQRIRGRWTHRDMYRDEFNRIWDAQAAHRPDLLTEERKKELFRTIFYQRRLRFDPSVIGRCELEPNCQRAAAYLLISQRFRLVQTVNNLRILPPGETETPLTPTDRNKLIDALELHGDQTFAQLRKLLGLPKGSTFNLERGGEKSIKGNRTNADFCKVFGERWLSMSPEERDRAVEYVYAFEKPDKLKHAAMKKWNLDDDAAETLSEMTFEPDYMNLSGRAMDKMLPLLECGFPYGTLAARYANLTPEAAARLIALADGGLPYTNATEQVLGNPVKSSQALPMLPPVDQALTAIRNPAVIRSLTELRKVVNAIIRQHGKPAEIHIELARDLRKPKWQRQEAADKMRVNEKARKAAAKRILDETGIKEPSQEDIRKVLLAEECRWECPYSGRGISMRKLVGQESEFQIEHIIPFSRSLDNTFVNLTLCHAEENKVKANRTPHEAYSGDPQRYEGMLGRVKKFTGSRGMLAEKLKRFQMTPEEVEGMLGDFSERQLRDTAYASKLASRYLSLLYGGLSDAEHQRRIHATPGRATAFLRNEWGLNAILRDGSTDKGGTIPKERTDHRHHAVDAVAIALTSPATVKMLSDAAQRAPIEHRRRFATIQSPWPNFVDSVREEIARIVVSHRVSRKVSGALHEETIYAAPVAAAGARPGAIRDRRTGGGRDSAAIAERRVRKPLEQLTRSEVEDIADERVRQMVVEKLGDGDPKKVFSNKDDLPFFQTADGRRIPIKRVRIKKAVPTFALGAGRTERQVTSESNHHLEIFAELDQNANEVEWDGVVVSMAEAYRRKKLGLPIVQRDFGRHRKFVLSLSPGELAECGDGKGGRRLLVVRGVSLFTGGTIQVGFAPVNDARKKADVIRAGGWVRIVPNKLRHLNARKMVVSPLGEVTEAHD